MIPAGLAFLYINQNFPDINLYTEDLRHPSKEGTYLAALMVFTTLSNKSPVGNKYIMGLDPEIASTLQEIAWKTHKEFKKILMGISNPVTSIASGNIEVEGGNTAFLEFLTKFQ